MLAPTLAQRSLSRSLRRLAFRVLLAFVAVMSMPGPTLVRWWAPNQHADTNEQENHTPTRAEPTQAARRLGDVPSPEGEHAARLQRRHVLHPRVALPTPSVVGRFIPRPYKTRFTLLH